ncbi:MAG: hypothetical protein NDI60_01110 [Elusimicrobiales bacterium]|nr:hypothetical protein [Elusimicrobiales bacterium]
MANIIRAVFTLFWLAAVSFIGFLAYIVVQTEADPQMLWGWLVMCAFTFVSATFLAYNIVFGHHHKSDAPHHHTHLQNS